MNWFTHSGKVFKPFYPSLHWDRRTSEKVVYLTFDDGPTPEVTEYVLDTLDQFNFKATFFCIGENVSKHPTIYQKVIDKGHHLGNHTYNHINGFESDLEEYVKNTELASDVIQSKLFRPPFGRIKRSQIKALKPIYDIIMWSVLSGDFDTDLNTNNAAKRMRSLTKPGSIVVFHDSQKAFNNLKVLLPEYCAFLTKNGYSSCGL